MADGGWREELDGWLEPFVAALGHGKRRRWAPVYLPGLLGPGERKSLQPMAARLGQKGHDQLHHFITSPAWDDAPLRRLLVAKADALVGGPDAVLVVDDTALPKQGKLSAGVARQYCGCLGKRANCQVLVSLTLARREVPVPVGLRLFLPETWAGDAERCARAAVPGEHRRALAKTDVALAEIDRVLAAGARFGRVVADAGYGTGAAFRKGLSERGLTWAVGIPKVQNVYSTAVELRWPKAAAGRPRKHPVPREEPVPAETVLENAEWRRVSWRTGTKGPLAAAFAAARVRPAEGEQLRNGRHLPGDEVWLVGERRASGEKKYHLANLPADAALEELAALIKARWACEQAHQQLKGELGLGHFEGRSWTGLHRHALMAMVAFRFLQHLRLAARGKKRARPAGTAAAADPARGPAPAARAAPPRPGPLPPLWC
ncbi:MAG TPA: IS701 family transposase [Geminicoccaceae bacterium]|nr:IS701 family transposase [Geminicoccaceae bacterium]